MTDLQPRGLNDMLFPKSGTKTNSGCLSSLNIVLKMPSKNVEEYSTKLNVQSS